MHVVVVPLVWPNNTLGASVRNLPVLSPLVRSALKQTFCECLQQPMGLNRYTHIKHLGIDQTHGRFGAVDVLQCNVCSRYWLQYFIDYEGFTASGRYFMGLITPEIAELLSPDQAVDFLSSLDWHLYGGSFFGRKGKSTGPINADL
jgi:hypothetical protein